MSDPCLYLAHLRGDHGIQVYRYSKDSGEMHIVLREDLAVITRVGGTNSLLSFLDLEEIPFGVIAFRLVRVCIWNHNSMRCC